MFEVGGESKKASAKDAIMALYGPAAIANHNPYGYMAANQQMMQMMAPPQPSGMVGMMPGGGVAMQANMHMQPMMMMQGGGMMPVQNMGGLPMQGGVMYAHQGGAMVMGGAPQPPNMYNLQQYNNIQQTRNQLASLNLMSDQHSGLGNYRPAHNPAGPASMPLGGGWGAPHHPVYPVSANIWQ
jgi:hypothetical protein